MTMKFLSSQYYFNIFSVENYKSIILLFFFQKGERGERENNFLTTKQLPLGYENYQHLLKNANKVKLPSNALIFFFVYAFLL